VRVCVLCCCHGGECVFVRCHVCCGGRALRVVCVCVKLQYVMQRVCCSECYSVYVALYYKVQTLQNVEGRGNER